MITNVTISYPTPTRRQKPLTIKMSSGSSCSSEAPISWFSLVAWPLFTRPGAFCEQQRLLVIFKLLRAISIFNKALEGYYSTDFSFSIHPST